MRSTAQIASLAHTDLDTSTVLPTEEKRVLTILELAVPLLAASVQPQAPEGPSRQHHSSIDG